MADGVPEQAVPVASELAATVAGILAAGRGAAVLRLAVSACVDAAEAACADRPMACGAGCPHCCVLNVAVLLPEGLIIADWLEERLPDAALDRLCATLTAHRSSIRWMEDEERIVKQAVCPFLDDRGSCLIHPVRPLVCRAVSSLDRAACRTAFVPAFTDSARLVPTDMIRRSAYDRAFLTLAAALHCYGLDDRSIELGTGVLAFLDQPECRDRFLAGERLPDGLWT